MENFISNKLQRGLCMNKSFNNSLKTVTTLSCNGKEYQIHNLLELSKTENIARLPYSLKTLLENLLHHETHEITGFDNGNPKTALVVANTEFDVIVRIDTPKEVKYMRHGGILQYVLRQLA